MEVGETTRRRNVGNGDLRNGERSEEQTEQGERKRIQREINLQIMRDKAAKIKVDLLDNFDNQLQDILDDFVQEVHSIDQPDYVRDSQGDKQRKKTGELPDKVFVPRASVLTELLEINHIRTIYHMFVAILIVFSLNTIVYDVVDQGRLVLNFEIIQWAFGQFPIVMWVWVGMILSHLMLLYPTFNWWANNRKGQGFYWLDWVAVSLYILYQTCYLLYPIQMIRDYQLPPASVVCIACEQVRLIMKCHAFVRENFTKALRYDREHRGEVSEESDLDTRCPGFSQFLYFLFAPTLVYRDHYPRTPTIRWHYVVSNFAQVFGCLFYTYYIFERFCIPVFRDFNGEHLTPRKFLLSAFGSMLPGTLVLLIGFFGILHSWLNAFAEMLRFADRLFYKDWWNSSSFSAYYRTWNVVVHDWLYTYIYKDSYKLLKHNRPLAMLSTFLLSAVFHEYILSLTLGFFYPVLFLMFQGAGFAFIFMPSKAKRSGNIFMWVSLFIGNGLLMCLYSMEWFARQRCPLQQEGIWDKAIPRSWTCDFSSMENNTE